MCIGLLPKRFQLCVPASIHLKERMCLFILTAQTFALSPPAQILPHSAHSSAEHCGLPDYAELTDTDIHYRTALSLRYYHIGETERQ